MKHQNKKVSHPAVSMYIHCLLCVMDYSACMCVFLQILCTVERRRNEERRRKIEGE